MRTGRNVESGFLSSELLILPDGRIFAQNLTQPMACLLSKLNPKDKTILPRAKIGLQNNSKQIL
jgi:hypothetical protein